MKLCYINGYYQRIRLKLWAKIIIIIKIRMMRHNKMIMITNKDHPITIITLRILDHWKLTLNQFIIIIIITLGHLLKV